MTAVGTRPGEAADLEFAIRVAREAGQLIAERYERLESIDKKSAKDVVTEADHLSEAHVIRSIRERFAGDGIVAEESGHHEDADGAALTSGRGRTWIIDPLDGTINYANGIPYFCVSIALAVDGRPSVGVVLDPIRDELFAASAGGPATLNGRPIRASNKDALIECVVSLHLGDPRGLERSQAVRKAVRASRSMGSSALALASVARGRFDAFAQDGGQSSWDVAAAGLIAERAGATVTDMTGGDWFDLSKPSGHWRVLAAPPPIHAGLLELVRTE